MRTITVVLVALVPLLLLTACGNEEEIAAKRALLKKLQAQFKDLNKELETKAPEWGKIKLGVIPARNRWMAAKRREDKDAIAAAKAEFDQVQAEAKEVTDLEQQLQRRIRDIGAKIRKVETQIQALGGGKPQR